LSTLLLRVVVLAERTLAQAAVQAVIVHLRLRWLKQRGFQWLSALAGHLEELTALIVHLMGKQQPAAVTEVILQAIPELMAPAGVVVRAAAQLLGKPLVLALLVKVLLVAAVVTETLAAAAVHLRSVSSKVEVVMDLLGLTALLMAVAVAGVITILEQQEWSRVAPVVAVVAETELVVPHRLV
jgi:hypothetical protein